VNNTKIEWCDSTWNPVTGCLHGCEYCYARRIAERFKGCDEGSTYWEYHQATWKRVNPGSKLEEALFEVDAKCPPINIRFDTKTQKSIHTKAPYPWGFQPTLRRDRLDEPQQWKKPRTIFVCSMADLFGEWVPDKWIEEVFAACEKAPQHTYVFLTKNPERYQELCCEQNLPIAKNMWFGATATNAQQMKRALNVFRFLPCGTHTFLSIEPIMCDMSWESDSWIEHIKHDVCPPVEWVILGAETGNRKGKVIPQKWWIRSIVFDCDKKGIAVFMKDSLIPIVGEENMRREFPWETAKTNPKSLK